MFYFILLSMNFNLMCPHTMLKDARILILFLDDSNDGFIVVIVYLFAWVFVLKPFNK